MIIGPVNDLSASAGFSGYLTESLYSTGSLGRSVIDPDYLSRNRSSIFDGRGLYSSEPGTVASNASLLQPYQTQALTYPFSAPSSYEAAMSPTIISQPRQFPPFFPPDPRSQLDRPTDAKYKLSMTHNDGRYSDDTMVEREQVHATSQTRSHSKDKVQWFCTICEHDTFRGKQEWIRHERNQHFPRHVYYCQPDIIVRNNKLYCEACKIENPGCNHVAKHDAYACALKDLPARRFASKEKFVKHLRSHELPSDCQQLDEWKRLLPELVWGCGFCIKFFENVEERLFHMSRHFERGMTRADWDPSRVLLSLLTLPYIATEWVLRLNVEFECYGQAWPEISWTKEDAMALQQRLQRVTSSQEGGADLAESVFNASIIGREFQRRKQELALGLSSLDPDSRATNLSLT